MRVLDEQGRLFGKINVIDFLVGLVAIALVVVSIIAVSGGSGALLHIGAGSGVGSRDAQDMTIVFLSTVPNALQIDVSKGDPVKKQGSSVELGRVSDFASQPATIEVADGDGRLRVVKSLLLADVRISVRAKVIRTDQGYAVGNEFIRLNEVVKLELPGAVFDGRVVEIRSAD
ncbi:MAG: DUF4330 domain-containing protein [Coriobacteriia bacterium]|nr:DUF4330 domain-containing protein [Coriobacteriia bacterium]